MAKRKTHEQFIEEMKIKQPNIEVLETYKGNNVPILCKCKIDGHEWYITPHNLLKGRGCPQCKIRNFTGENNPRWNNELTDEERNEERNTVEYKQWRDECFRRDNYTCQLTGEVGRIEVHHIYSYDKHKNLRLEVSNGITILKDVHKLFHSIYGYGNNTKEQWEEFVKNFK